MGQSIRWCWPEVVVRGRRQVTGWGRAAFLGGHRRGVERRWNPSVRPRRLVGPRRDRRRGPGCRVRCLWRWRVRWVRWIRGRLGGPGPRVAGVPPCAGLVLGGGWGGGALLGVGGWVFAVCCSGVLAGAVLL